MELLISINDRSTGRSLLYNAKVSGPEAAAVIPLPGDVVFADGGRYVVKRRAFVYDDEATMRRIVLGVEPLDDDEHI